MHHGKVPKGRLKKLSRHSPEFGQRIGDSQSRSISRCPGNFQSYLRDFSSLKSLLRTASRAKFSRPSGLIWTSTSSQANTKALDGSVTYGTVEAAPIVVLFM